MLAIVNLIWSPNVRMRTPKFSLTGSSSPNVFPKESQDRAGMPLVSWAIKLPSTIPARRSKKSAHVFFPVRAIDMIPPEYCKWIGKGSAFTSSPIIHQRKKIINEKRKILFDVEVFKCRRRFIGRADLFGRKVHI